MASIDLTQTEADALLALPKVRVSDEEWTFPDLGGSLIIPLSSVDRRENFLLDVQRGRIDLMKGTFQNRARHVVILVRLDFGGAPHRNPDDREVPSPHLHVYREGYGDRWAIPVPAVKFPHIGDAWLTLSDFMNFCNITSAPHIKRTLFT